MPPTSKIEFGDFQTPDDFAARLVSLLPLLGISPGIIIEPTCGFGSFLLAASKVFPSAKLFGNDINKDYVRTAKARLGTRAEIRHANFFDVDWSDIVGDRTEPVLFLGNPPWVTNSALGTLGSANHPLKTNIKGLKGFDTRTGKSNFDISEWMLIRLLEALQSMGGTVAILCKTAVARKLLKYAHDQSLSFSDGRIFRIDAAEIFGVAVDACFFVFTVHPGMKEYKVDDYESVDLHGLASVIGVFDGQLVANIDLYETSRLFDGVYKQKWRSGVKHDCSKVMEFHITPQGMQNGFDEIVDIEPDYVFPLLKSSDLANSRIACPNKRVLITQHHTGEDTSPIQKTAPKTWRYLMKHSSFLDKRQSSIYHNRPSFSIFGIGDYSFTPWKVAISGFYKSLQFRIIPPFNSKPVMLDDTCYFLSCENEEEANELYKRLRSKSAQDFFNSVVFWDAKRPLNTEILQRLDLDRLPSTILAATT